MKLTIIIIVFIVILLIVFFELRRYNLKMKQFIKKTLSEKVRNVKVDFDKDEKALREDWEKVGEDFKKVLGNEV